MADPFECRMRIIHMLQNLTASAVSQQKAAAFALKHKDLDEDLHSCILEQLERVSTSQGRLCAKSRNHVTLTRNKYVKSRAR